MGRWSTGATPRSTSSPTPCTTAAAPSRACAPTTRSNGTAIFRLQEHTQRLFNSAKILRMKIPFSFEEVFEAQRTVVRENKLESLLPAAAHLDRLREARRLAQGQHRAPDGRRLALGRLPRRGRHEARHPRQDLELHPAPRQHHDDAGQGGLATTPTRSSPTWRRSTTATTRRCCSTPAASSAKAPARTCSWSSTASSTPPTSRPARSTASPATPSSRSATTSA